MSQLDAPFWQRLQADLLREQVAYAARFPGDSAERQPISVLYGGAHLFTANTPSKVGALAVKALERHAPSASAFAEVFSLDEALAAKVHPRVKAKLEREPLEDYRIDFEDGFGPRSDAEEDDVAVRAGRELASASALPPFIGIRVKPMTAELGVRAVRTLDLFLAQLPALPAGFVVTLPKVVTVGQAQLFVRALEQLEQAHGLAAGSLRLEIMVEAAQGLVDAEGREILPQLHAALGARLRGAHFGTYDFTASQGIAAAEQHMRHPACDAGKALMQRAFAGTGVWLSDGATTQLPVPLHREERTAQQREANQRAVIEAWRRSTLDTLHSLSGGFYQGWDLHPAQLVSRYAAVYTFFLANIEQAARRLSQFVSGLGQATRSGTSFDDAATGQGLLNFFLRGLASGALTDAEVSAAGLTTAELAGRSFAAIAARRRA